MPPSTIGPTGWSWYSKDVTIPKLPPPPRNPQKRSSFSDSLALRNSPPAVITSAERRLSQVSPHFRSSQPLPLPKVRPAMPVWVTCPPVVVSLVHHNHPPSLLSVPDSQSNQRSRIWL